MSRRHGGRRVFLLASALGLCCVSALESILSLKALYIPPERLEIDLANDRLVAEEAIDRSSLKMASVAPAVLMRIEHQASKPHYDVHAVIAKPEWHPVVPESQIAAEPRPANDVSMATPDVGKATSVLPSPAGPALKLAAPTVVMNEVIEDIRRVARMRAYCSASFAAGITVGVVGTLLLLSLGTDRLPLPFKKKFVKSAAVEREPESSVFRNPDPVPDTHFTASHRQGCPPVDDTSEGLTESTQVEANTDAEHCVESIHRFGPRCSFLVAMLLVQSLSSIVLAGFQDLIQSHPSIVFFLTMVVGTGGNVGGQSVVLAVRRLAKGEEVAMTEQFRVGIQLSMVLAPLALIRAYMQGTKLAVCLTIGLATLLIVVVAAALGTALPKLLNQVRVDPAHATPVIQVLMDMVGVLVTCVIGHVVLDVVLKVPST